MFPKQLFFWVFFLFILLDLQAQPKNNQRFSAAGYIGANLSQIDGDYYFGYNKPGLRFGVETQYLFKPKFYLSVGLGFSQLGTKPTRKEISSRGGRSIGLRINTLEIPVLFNYRLGKKTEYTKKADYKLYRSSVLQFGVAYYRSFGYQVSQSGNLSALPVNQNFVAVEDKFEQSDLYAIIGVTIQFDAHWGLFIQHGKSIRGLYRPKGTAQNQVLPLFPYFLTLGGRYVLY